MNGTPANPFAYLTDACGDYLAGRSSFARRRGRVERIAGSVVHAQVPGALVGELCLLSTGDWQMPLQAEVVGVSGCTAILAPYASMQGLSTGTEVEATGRRLQVKVGEHLLGRVLDGLGLPLDGLDSTAGGVWRDIEAPPPNPLERRPIDRVLTTGVRAIDGLLTCGEGQRLGIFAAAGVGKSSLLAMLSRHAEVDVIVAVLIGERGREVGEFVERQMGTAGRKRSVVVAATSDQTALQRVRAASTGTAIAEHFRDQGKRVLLLMDSLTRYARALREIGLAAGEVPARRGFPPSVFAAMPRLLERAGQSATGSITGFYTVLVEGDDPNEPVADEARSLLDGHILLSRELAGREHYPAIDILESRSRLMDKLVGSEWVLQATAVRRMMARYLDVELLIRMGEYQKGADVETDRAIERQPQVESFLRQGETEQVALESTQSMLAELSNG